VLLIKKITSLVALCLILLPCATFADTAATQSLLNTLKNIKTFSADFEQTINSDGHNIAPAESGFMQVMSPGLFYWQTDAQVIYVRSDKVIIYDKTLEQVTVRALGDSLDQLPLMLLFGQASEALAAFDVVQNGDQYSLVPLSDNAMIEKIIIVFSDDVLESLKIIGAVGQETEVVFSHQKINSSLDQTLFQEKIPSGVDVVAVGT